MLAMAWVDGDGSDVVDLPAASQRDRRGDFLARDALRGTPCARGGPGADLPDGPALDRVAYDERPALAAYGDPDGAARPQRRARDRHQSAAGRSAAGEAS